MRGGRRRERRHIARDDDDRQGQGLHGALGEVLLPRREMPANWALGGAIEVFLKILIYYLHERAWAAVPRGTRHQASRVYGNSPGKPMSSR